MPQKRNLPDKCTSICVFINTFSKSKKYIRTRLTFLMLTIIWQNFVKTVLLHNPVNGIDTCCISMKYIHFELFLKMSAIFVLDIISENTVSVFYLVPNRIVFYDKKYGQVKWINTIIKNVHYVFVSSCDILVTIILVYFKRFYKLFHEMFILLLMIFVLFFNCLFRMNICTRFRWFHLHIEFFKQELLCLMTLHWR